MGTRRRPDDHIPTFPSRSEFSLRSCARSTLIFHSEYYTHELLCHLRPDNSPTFHNFNDLGIVFPNATFEMLDIGCGRGLWAAETAVAYRNVHVTGLDMVTPDTSAYDWMTPEQTARLTLRQSN